MKRTALFIMLLVTLAKITGFLREITLSYFFGASEITDAYFVAQTIPRVLIKFIGVGVVAGFIPIYTRIKDNQGFEMANKFTNQVLHLSFVFSTFIVLLVLFFPEAVLFAFASGFDGAQKDFAILFIRIMVFATYFMSFQHVFKGFLHANNTFWAPAIIGVPINIVIIASIFIASQNNPVAMAYGYVIATASQMALILPVVIKKKFSYRINISLTDDKVKLLLITILPIMLSVGVNDINEIISQNIASQFVEGSLSAMNYARRLNSFMNGVIISAITAAMFPIISRMAAQGDISRLKKVLNESVNFNLLILVPAAVGGMIFSQEIISLVFGRGEFDDIAIGKASRVLFFLLIGLPFIGLKNVFQRAFFALNDTKTPLLVTILSVSTKLSFALMIYFFTNLEIAGLALATSIATIVGFIFLFLFLRKKIGVLKLKNMVMTALKILVASLLMGILVKWLYVQLLSITSTVISFSYIEELVIVVSILTGALVYFILVLIFRVKEVETFFNLFKRKFLLHIPNFNNKKDTNNKIFEEDRGNFLNKENEINDIEDE